MELNLFKTLTLLFCLFGTIQGNSQQSCSSMVESLHNDTLILKELENVPDEKLNEYTSNFECLE